MVLAIGVNGAFFLLLLSSHRPPAPESASVAMIWIMPLEPVVARVSLQRATSRFAGGEVAVETPPPESQVLQEPALVRESGSIEGVEATAAPGIALAHDESAVRRFLDDEERRQRNSLDSRPQVLVIPERPHMPGDTEQYGGMVLTWMNERCYWARDTVAFGGVRARLFCKNPTLAERRAEAHRQEMLDAMKSEFLKRPLPKPGQRNHSKLP